MWLHAKFAKHRIRTSTEAKMKEAVTNPLANGAFTNPLLRNADGATIETNKTGVPSACDRSQSKKSSLDFYPQSNNNPDGKPDGEDEQSIQIIQHVVTGY